MVTCARAVGAQEVVLLRENKVINPPQGPSGDQRTRKARSIEMLYPWRGTISKQKSLWNPSRRNRDVPICRVKGSRRGQSKETIRCHCLHSAASATLFRDLCNRDTFSRDNAVPLFIWFPSLVCLWIAYGSFRVDKVMMSLVMSPSAALSIELEP